MLWLFISLIIHKLQQIITLLAKRIQIFLKNELFKSKIQNGCQIHPITALIMLMSSHDAKG